MHNYYTCMKNNLNIAKVNRDGNTESSQTRIVGMTTKTKHIPHFSSNTVSIKKMYLTSYPGSCSLGTKLISLSTRLIMTVQ